MKKNEIYYFTLEMIDNSYSKDIKVVLFKDYNIDIHKHNFFEVNFVTSGKGIHYFAGNTFEVEKGDVFVVPINVEHAYKSIENLTVFHLVLSRDFFEKHTSFFANNKEYVTLFLLEPQLRQIAGFDIPLFFKLDESQIDEAASILLEIHKQQVERSHETDTITFGLSIALLFFIFRIYREKIEKTSFNSKKIYSINSVINSIYSSNPFELDIKKLANISGYSKTNFFRVFKKAMNCTPGQYIIKYKLEKAKKLLLETDMSVKEISDLCGFYDSAHFIRTFKNSQKITPTEYRKNDQN